jgi:hypothetical protein
MLVDTWTFTINASPARESLIDLATYLEHSARVLRDMHDNGLQLRSHSEGTLTIDIYDARNRATERQ